MGSLRRIGQLVFFIQASFCVWLSRGTEDSNTFVGQLIRCGDLGSCDDCISIFTT